MSGNQMILVLTIFEYPLIFSMLVSVECLFQFETFRKIVILLDIVPILYFYEHYEYRTYLGRGCLMNEEGTYIFRLIIV